MSHNKWSAIIFSMFCTYNQQLSSYPKIRLQEVWLPKVNSKHLTLQKSPKQDCGEVLYKTYFQTLLHGQKSREGFKYKILLHLILLPIYYVFNKVQILHFTIGFKKLNAY